MYEIIYQTENQASTKKSHLTYHDHWIQSNQRNIYRKTCTHSCLFSSHYNYIYIHTHLSLYQSCTNIYICTYKWVHVLYKDRSKISATHHKNKDEIQMGMKEITKRWWKGVKETNLCALQSYSSLISSSEEERIPFETALQFLVPIFFTRLWRGIVLAIGFLQRVLRELMWEVFGRGRRRRNDSTQIIRSSKNHLFCLCFWWWWIYTEHFIWGYPLSRNALGITELPLLM